MKSINNHVPLLQKRKVKDKIYYVYQRGTDQPIYLGSADFILICVQMVKRSGYKVASNA